MTVVDSSGWIEYLEEKPHASSVEKYLVSTDSLVVPTLIFYEVFRQLIKKSSEEEALLAVTQMEKGIVVPLSQEISIYAAQLSLKHKLGTADAIIYASAQMNDAELITLDNDFRDLPGCTVINSTNK